MNSPTFLLAVHVAVERVYIFQLAILPLKTNGWNLKIIPKSKGTSSKPL